MYALESLRRSSRARHREEARRALYAQLFREVRESQDMADPTEGGSGGVSDDPWGYLQGDGTVAGDELGAEEQQVSREDGRRGSLCSRYIAQAAI